MKIRLWGTAAECRAAAERLMATPGLVVLSVSEPYADRGASRLVRVFLETRLDPPPAPRPDERPGARADEDRRPVPPGPAARW